MNRLPVFETFYSIQGEGKNSGMAAFFIRLAGCNVGCNFCDEKRAWNTNNSSLQSIQEIIELIKLSKAKNVVVTGGEPTLYDLTELTEKLHKTGIKTFLETSGVNHITGYWDWITLSPKQMLYPLPLSLSQANEIKVVIKQKEDFLFAERMRLRANEYLDLQKYSQFYYLQAEYSQYAEILPQIIEYIKQNPIWRLSLQTHKMINIK
ncbi:MAG: 7-carboxy-7-deazaguanine synthase QueE [Bacteroidales bacterium]